jgi:uncharacterized membrane protein YphA (DoxX/SURF4 family)
MKTVVQLNKWANSHTNILIDVVRIVTGLFLIFKGLQFSFQTHYLADIISSSSLGTGMFLEHYIAMAHIAGGLLVAMGLITRWALLAQLPIIIGAVAVNFMGSMNTTNLLQASAVLLITLFFIFYGSGKHSVDYSLKMNM